MEEITIYQAKDGRQFDVMADCQRHEAIIGDVEKAMERLPERPDDTDYLNGQGYLQHEENAVEWLRAVIIRMAEEHHPETVKRDNQGRVNMYMLGRMLDDYGSPINSAFFRYQCIDDMGREWGQPGFVTDSRFATFELLNP